MLFPEIAKPHVRFGVGVLVAIAKVVGRKASLRTARRESFNASPGRRPRDRLLAAMTERDLARLLAGLAHPQRIRIARAILTGANTHHALCKAMKLSPGPLYHHLRALERAGLLTVVDRNRYDLTGRARDLLLITTTACTLKTR